MRKNVASQVIGAQMVNASTGAAFTGSVTCYVCGDGGTQAVGSVGSGACTHEGNGFHTYTPAQSETNYNHVAFTFIGTGAIPATVQVYTISYDPHDTADLGLTNLDAAITSRMASYTQPTGFLAATFPTTVASTTNITAGTITTVSGNVNGSVASVTGAVGSVTGAVGSVTGNVGGNVTGSVGSIATGGITATSFSAGAIDAAAIAADAIGASELAADAVAEIQAGLSTLDAAGVRAAVGLAAANLDTQLSTIDGNVDAILVDTGTTLETHLTDIKGATFSGATDSLEAIRDRGDAAWITATGFSTHTAADVWTSGTRTLTASLDPTAAAIADAVWDEVLAGHLTAGTTGAALNAAGAAGDPWTTSLPGAYGAGSAGYIVGTYLDASVSSRLATAGYTAPLDAAGTRTAVGLAAANLDTQLSTIDGVVDAILLDTAQIGLAGAGLTALPWNAAWDAQVESEVADALAVYDPPTHAEVTAAVAGLSTLDAAGVRAAVGMAAADLDTQLATIGTTALNVETDTQDIQSRLPAALVGGRMDADVQSIGGSTSGVSGFDMAVRSIVRGVIGVGSTTGTLVTASLDPAAVIGNQFKGLIVKFDRDTVTAALRGQGTDITASGISGVLTVTALTTAPVAGDTFTIE